MIKPFEVGDRAPDFELRGGDGQVHRLSDYRGQPVILLFYPLDFSKSCTRQHEGLCDVLPSLERHDAQVLGISVDSHWAHTAYAEATDIPYPLLADFHPKGAVGRMYGVYDPDKGHHRRSTFVVDADGRVALVQQSAPGELPDLDELLTAVAATEE